jgi:pimeloyl-ACP methyl ester carboxylesterase
MRRAGLAGFVVLLAWAGSAAAQAPDESKQNVSFDTADDARLVGTFYRGPKGNESPAVMIIHRFMSDRTAKGIDQLARDLQAKLNCSVLAFDLRGHGGSKQVGNKFWTFEHNRNGIRGGNASRTKTEISASEFRGSYWPILLNDIAAARHYLDTQNDAQRANTSSLIVIAAQDSAGLAMGWATHECERKAVPVTATVGSINPNIQDPGDDLAACVWLGPVGRGGGVSFRVSEWFGRVDRLRSGTPMFFLYGKQDSASASVVPGMISAIRRPPEGIRSKHNFDKEEGLQTRLPGQDLLGNPALNANDKIIAWLDGVMKARKQTAWRAMNVGPPRIFPIQSLGFAAPG